MKRQVVRISVVGAVAAASAVAFACVGVPSNASAPTTSVAAIATSSIDRVDNQRRLTDDLPGGGSRLAAGRDGRDRGRLVVSVPEQSGDKFRLALVTMRVDGTHRVQLTHPDWGYQDMPGVWSPNGRRIAFQRTDPDGYPNIMTINADGTGLTQLTHCSIATDPCLEQAPVWMPDGKTLVFEHCCVSTPAGFLDGIYTIRADGTQLKRVTLNPDIFWGDGVPAVSPDGRWIAFSRFIGAADDPENKNVSAMFLVRPDGTRLHRITSYDLMVDEKDWSPDGRRIVFTTHAGSNDGPFRADVFSVRPDGTGLRALTHTTPGEDLAFFPTWSPDGRTILFNYNSGDCPELRTMRPDGTHVRQLTDPRTCGFWPDWTGKNPEHHRDAAAATAA